MLTHHSQSVRDKGSASFTDTFLAPHIHLMYQRCTQHSSRLGAVKNIGIAITPGKRREKKLYKLSSLSAGQGKINRYQCRKCQMSISISISVYFFFVREDHF